MPETLSTVEYVFCSASVVVCATTKEILGQLAKKAERLAAKTPYSVSRADLDRWAADHSPRVWDYVAELCRDEFESRKWAHTKLFALMERELELRQQNRSKCLSWEEWRALPFATQRELSCDRLESISISCAPVSASRQHHSIFLRCNRYMFGKDQEFLIRDMATDAGVVVF